MAVEKRSASQRPCDFCGPAAVVTELHVDSGTPTAATLVNGSNPATTDPPGSEAVAERSHAEEEPMTLPTTTDQESSSTDRSNADRATNAAKGRGRSPLRKLSDEQEVELTRLYSATNTPVPEIARRFEVGESSVYRIAQRHGAALRSVPGTRGPATQQPRRRKPREQAAVQAPQTARPSRGRPRRSAAAPETSAPAAVRGRSRTARATPSATAPARARRRSSRATPSQGAARSTGTKRRFRVLFLAATVVEADSMRDAIAQAEARGATDITSVALAE
jgi:hypothetical protein